MRPQRVVSDGPSWDTSQNLFDLPSENSNRRMSPAPPEGSSHEEPCVPTESEAPAPRDLANARRSSCRRIRVIGGTLLGVGLGIATDVTGDALVVGAYIGKLDL